MWIKLLLGEEADIQELRCTEDGGARKLLSRLTLPNCGKCICNHTHATSEGEKHSQGVQNAKFKKQGNRGGMFAVNI